MTVLRCDKLSLQAVKMTHLTAFVFYSLWEIIKLDFVYETY